MKKIIYSLVLILTVTISCKKKDIINNVASPEKQIVKVTEMPFQGTWSRSFAMGKGVDANVTYTIFQDSIQYLMKGPMNMKYTLLKDVFSAKDNRWIGKRNEMPYVIFFKNISKDSITILKMKVESKEKAMKMAFPSDTARSKFSSWNTFAKK